MEAFPLDIQRLLLSMVANGRVYRLRHLFCVNRLWRQRVSRYLLDTTNKEWFLDEMLKERLMWSLKRHFTQWNVFDRLAEQWTPTLLGAYIMFLRGREEDNHILLWSEHFVYAPRRAEKLFYKKQSILQDMRKKEVQNMNVRRQDEHIQKTKELLERAQGQVRKYEHQLEDHCKKRDAAQELNNKLDMKWQAKKSKQ